jgi:predicted RNA-binding Zn ribbon-like protein
METPEHIRAMRLVGGNPALDFVNTRSGPPIAEPDADSLCEYADLVAWARYAGLLTDAESIGLARLARNHAREARKTFDRAINARATIDAVFRTVSRGERPSAPLLDQLASLEADALEHGRLVEGSSGFAWRWQADDLGRPLWPVVHTAVELLTAGRLDRLKGCGGCRFLFLDDTRNGSRRWCSMDDCGTAQKMRNYVTRRAARRTAERTTLPASGPQ